MTVVFALLAGLGLGVPLGILYARWDQRGVYDLITATVDRITTAALFPGLKGIVDSQPAPEVPTGQRMYDSVDVDEQEETVRVPAWIKDDKSPAAWDPYEEVKT